MKKALWITGILFTASAAVMAQKVTLAGVMEKYYAAGNLEKLHQVQTLVMTGTIVQQDLMPVKVYRARPAKYCMVFDVADMTAYQAYDGQTAWFTAPWTGKADPQVATPDRATDLRNRADIDGLLYDWKQKGHKLELDGTDTLDGQKLYKIRMTRKDGGIEYNYIDTAQFLLRKRVSFRQAGGKEITVENYFRDYRPVDGIPFPFTVQTNNGGRVNEIQYESVELDVPVDLSVFIMPAK